jgi:hypothetical protein
VEEMTKGSRKYLAGYILTLLSSGFVVGGFMTAEVWSGFNIFIWGGILEINRREKNARSSTEVS